MYKKKILPSVSPVKMQPSDSSSTVDRSLSALSQSADVVVRVVLYSLFFYLTYSTIQSFVWSLFLIPTFIVYSLVLSDENPKQFLLK